MIHIYGIKNCDSVKKALAFFKAHDIAYSMIDFKTDPVGCDIIETWLAEVTLSSCVGRISGCLRSV